MTTSSKSHITRKREGFTLLEVMVALIVGTVIAGGVMGLISVSLQYKQRLKEKNRIQPVLEAIAQELLAHPEKAAEGSRTVKNLPDVPPVDIAIIKIQTDRNAAGARMDELHRVLLRCGGQMLEFSLLIPQSGFQ